VTAGLRRLEVAQGGDDFGTFERGKVLALDEVEAEVIVSVRVARARRGEKFRDGRAAVAAPQLDASSITLVGSELLRLLWRGLCGGRGGRRAGCGVGAAAPASTGCAEAGCVCAAESRVGCAVGVGSADALNSVMRWRAAAATSETFEATSF
jgi:hypothetical protein